MWFLLLFVRAERGGSPAGAQRLAAALLHPLNPTPPHTQPTGTPQRKTCLPYNHPFSASISIHLHRGFFPSFQTTSPLPTPPVLHHGLLLRCLRQAPPAPATSGHRPRDAAPAVRTGSNRSLSSVFGGIGRRGGLALGRRRSSGCRQPRLPSRLHHLDPGFSSSTTTTTAKPTASILTKTNTPPPPQIPPKTPPSTPPPPIQQHQHQQHAHRIPAEANAFAAGLRCMSAMADKCGPSTIRDDPSIHLKLLTQLVMSLATLSKEDETKRVEWWVECFGGVTGR